MKTGSILIGTLMLSGCATIDAMQMGEIEAIPVAPDAPAQWAAAGVSGSVDTGDWISEFNDPQMAQLVDEALTNNYSLAAQVATVRAAVAEARSQRGSLLPFVSAGANAGGIRSVFQDFGGDPVTNERATYGLSVNASWEADLWGRLAAGVDIAESQALIAEADLQSARLSIASQTAIAWINLNAAVAQQQVAQASFEARLYVAELTERRFARGLTTALDVRTARSALASAEAGIAARTQAVGEAARRLEVLTGRYPANEITAPATLPRLDPIEIHLNPTLLLARRPDIAAAEARLAQAGLRAEQARLALYPSLNITASLSTDSDRVAEAFDPAFIAARAIASLTQPLYAGGQLTAQAEAFLERVELAMANYASSALTAWREVEDAFAADMFLAAQEEAQKRALEEAALAEDLTQRRYTSTDTISIFNLIDAQTRRLNAESALVTARSNRAVNRVQYYLALGGGLPQPPSPPNAGTPGGSQIP